jgi:hypothetical protein
VQDGLEVHHQVRADSVECCALQALESYSEIPMFTDISYSLQGSLENFLGTKQKLALMPVAYIVLLPRCFCVKKLGSSPRTIAGPLLPVFLS